MTAFWAAWTPYAAASVAYSLHIARRLRRIRTGTP